MVPPLSVMSYCSSSRQTTGCAAVAASISVVLASARPSDVAGKLDDGALQAEADAEERDPALAGEADGLDLARDAAVAEAARHQDAVDAAQHALGPLALDFLGLDLADQYPTARGNAGVVERLVDRLVGVVVLDVLADHGDRHLVRRVR